MGRAVIFFFCEDLEQSVLMKTKTIDRVACLGAMAILLVLAQVTQAAITITEVSGNGSNSILYEGPVTFPDYNNYTGPGTIIAKSLDDMDPYVLSVAYLASDFDYTQAFRWAERVTNPAGSGKTWDAFCDRLAGYHGYVRRRVLDAGYA